MPISSDASSVPVPSPGGRSPELPLDFLDGGPGTTLTIHIENVRPVELLDLTTSLTALAEQFRGFVRRREPIFVEDDYRLFVKEVRTGSIVAELVSYASQLPVLAPAAPLIVQYAAELGDWFDFFKGVKDASELKDFLLGTSKKDMQQVSQVLEPVAKDAGSRITFIAQSGGTIINHINLASVEANAVQNGIRRQIEALPETRNGKHLDQVLYWYQVRDDAAKKPGDLAVIERFDRRPVKVRFASDEVKHAMLDAPENLFKRLFVVDVDVTEIDERPVLYRILQVTDSYDRPG